MAELEQLAILGQIALAMLLGSVIGYDREVHDKPAGLRTHMFISGSAALLVALGDIIVAEATPDSAVQTDPLRILEAVVTGVSFLGAGTILQRRGGVEIKGLTTAASMLFAAGAGVGIALDQYILAIGATALALLTLRTVGIISRRLPHSPHKQKKEEHKE